jgi:hypothetical protein
MHKFIRVVALTASLMVLPPALSASGQTDSSPGGPGNTAPGQTRGDNRDQDWGWIGLLGLVGLAGLLRRERPAHQRTSDPLTSR